LVFKSCLPSLLALFHAFQNLLRWVFSPSCFALSVLVVLFIDCKIPLYVSAVTVWLFVLAIASTSALTSASLAAYKSICSFEKLVSPLAILVASLLVLDLSLGVSFLFFVTNASISAWFSA